MKYDFLLPNRGWSNKETCSITFCYGRQFLDVCDKAKNIYERHGGNVFRYRNPKFKLNNETIVKLSETLKELVRKEEHENSLKKKSKYKTTSTFFDEVVESGETIEDWIERVDWEEVVRKYCKKNKSFENPV